MLSIEPKMLSCFVILALSKSFNINLVSSSLLLYCANIATNFKSAQRRQTLALALAAVGSLEMKVKFRVGLGLDEGYV